MKPYDARVPVVAFALDDWNDLWMSRQQILSRLGKRGWFVIYNNGALSLWDRNTEAWRNSPWLGNIYETDNVHINETGRFLPIWPKSQGFSKLAEWFYVQNIQRYYRRKTHHKHCIAYVFHPIFWPYIEWLKPQHVIYHAYDAFSCYSDWNSELAHYQDKLLDRADIVITLTQSQLDLLPLKDTSKARLIPSGVDVEAFVQGVHSQCPEDLKAIPHPRISYIGNITQKVDFNLIADIARTKPDWHWVLIGPAGLGKEGDFSHDPVAEAGWRLCRSLANIHFLGRKHHSDLPSYTAHMDVNTLCYKVDGTWVVHGYPLKLHEYLATGLPVIGSALKIFDEFSDVMAICNTPEEWINAIEQALSTGGIGTPQQRQETAFKNSWDSRVEDLEGWLLQLLSSP